MFYLIVGFKSKEVHLGEFEKYQDQPTVFFNIFKKKPIFVYN